MLLLLEEVNQSESLLNTAAIELGWNRRENNKVLFGKEKD